MFRFWKNLRASGGRASMRRRRIMPVLGQLESLEARQLMATLETGEMPGKEVVLGRESSDESAFVNRAAGPLQLLANAGRMTRIVGGTTSEQVEWPWMASLQDNGGHFCGGTLVNPGVVVTAAHCVQGNTTGLSVLLGTNDLSNGSGQRHEVEEVKIHPNYDSNTSDSDIAVLFLASRSNQPSLPLLRPERGELAAPGVKAVVTGWGATAEGGRGSSVLREVEVPIVSTEVANQTGSYDGKLTATMLAAGRAEGGVDSCQGDSGGPLMVADGRGQHYLAGVVSWGDGCARPLKYGIYSRVTALVDWVDSAMSLSSAGAVQLSASSYLWGSSARITVQDRDLAGRGSLEVLVSTSDGDSLPVRLVESFGGRFSGNVELRDEDAVAGDDRLQVRGAAQLLVTYLDENDGTGVAVSRDATASLVKDDFGDDASAATLVALPGSITGDLQSTSDVDMFRVNVTPGVLYEFRTVLNGSLKDSVLTLLSGSDQSILAKNDDDGNNTNSRIIWHNDSGETVVYLEVSGYDGAQGTFELQVSERTEQLDDHGSEAANATPIKVGSAGLEGSIEWENDKDYFVFEAEAGHTYSIRTDLGTLWDSMLKLFGDSEGQLLLDTNDDSDGLASRINWEASSTGKLYVEVTGVDSTGSYSLQVLDANVDISDDHANGPTGATALTLPEYVTGRIEVSGDRDFFRFEAKAGVCYDIRTLAGTLDDSQVTLFAADGASILAQDDDSGLGLTSQLLWTATVTDTVFVAVDAYGRITGSYGLSVSVPAGDANLDGRFDSLDLLQIMQRGEYEDEQDGNSDWKDGDWNGDGDFDVSDIVLAFQTNVYLTDVVNALAIAAATDRLDRKVS